MKIIATCRTLNEEHNIDAYCQAYQFADQILIADGGSTDNTIELALKYPKVQIQHYDVTVELKNGTRRNPDGPHVQFLVDWATAEGGDWIIHQDCDQRPNKYLKHDAREILHNMDKDFLQVTQIFLWGKDKYFPALSKAGDQWMQGLWAWRLSTGLKIVDNMPHYFFSFDGENMLHIGETGRHRNVLPPYCFLHFGWQSEEQVQKHVKYYRETGLISNMAYPTDFAGTPVPLLDWMVE
jgi:glycosyltransferase involved in cell wall biosynthesis